MKQQRDNSLIRIAFCSTVLLFFVTPVSAQPDLSSQAVTIGQSYTLNSDILDEERIIHVALPVYYEAADQQYPVLYLLDGTEHFGHAATLVDFLAKNEFIPPAIVVAIANTNRDRDFTTPSVAEPDRPQSDSAGGADRFLDFLSDELTPWVEENYRANDYRMIFGHSLTGFFTIYAMLVRPEIFDAYIAASPSLWWNNEQLVQMIESEEFVFSDQKETLFISHGDEGVDTPAAFEKLITALQSAVDNIHIAYEQLPQEIHVSTPHRTIHQGLEFVFDGWFANNALDQFEGTPIADIHVYYAELDGEYDTDRGTPPSVITQLAGRLIELERYREAADIVLYDPVNFPTHPDNLNWLASLLDLQTDAETAKALYTQALRFAPGNQTAREQLASMGENIERLVDEVAPDSSLLNLMAGRYSLPNGNIWEFRAENRGLEIYINDAPQGLVMLSPISYTVGPSLIYMEFLPNESGNSVTMRIRASTSDWEPTQKLD